MVEEKKKEKEQRRKIDQKNVTQNVRISKPLSITALILNFNSLIKVTTMTVLKITPNIISSSKKYTLMAKAHPNFEWKTSQQCAKQMETKTKQEALYLRNRLHADIIQNKQNYCIILSLRSLGLMDFHLKQNTRSRLKVRNPPQSNLVNQVHQIYLQAHGWRVAERSAVVFKIAA